MRRWSDLGSGGAVGTGPAEPGTSRHGDPRHRVATVRIVDRPSRGQRPPQNISVLEAIAEYDIGTLYPMRSASVEAGLVEGAPTGHAVDATPPDGQGWTSDEQLRQILDRLADT
jgi:hypothetical protein